MFILAPGHKTPWVNLNAAAHDARENVRTARQSQVDKRKASGAPESDNTNYVEIAKALIAAQGACEKGADAELQDALGGIGTHFGARVAVPEPFEPAPDTEALEVRVISMSRGQYNDQSQGAWSAAALGDLEPAKVFLTQCVEVRGFDIEGEIKGADLWEEADLIWTLMAVAVHFQELTHAEKKLYGSPVAQT